MTDNPLNKNELDKLEKEVRSIAEYLGCNEGELWSEVSKIFSGYISKQELSRLLEDEYKRGYEKRKYEEQGNW